MNEEIKNEWVKRLRSGDIPQGARLLGHIGGERCCLGVLCDIAVEEKVISLEVDAHGRLQYGDAITLLPVAVREWADIKYENPSTRYGYSLAGMNDDDRMTFAEIADVIEHFWEDF